MVKPGTMNILIVDDMENMCRSIRAMLKILKFGKSYTIAHNGRQAWKLLTDTQESYDFAFIDWNMPVMTGVELLGMIRKDKTLRDMPIIMITAEANMEIVAEVAESAIDAYLLKPLTVKSLGDKIKAALVKVYNPPPVIFHMKRARDLDEDGDPEQAMDELKLAIAADPESSKPIREMGILLYKKNDMKKAQRCFIEAATMNQLDVLAFHYLGEIYLKKNDINNASKFFEKAMEISPRHVERAIYFGKILASNGLAKKSKKVFNKAIGLANDPLTLQEEVVAFCMEQKMYDYCIKLYNNLLSNYVERVDLILNLSLACEKIAK